MVTGAGIILLGLLSIFLFWIFFGGNRRICAWGKLFYWFGSTLFTTLVLIFWLMYRYPQLGFGYSVLLSFCCGAFMNLFKSYAGLMIP